VNIFPAIDLKDNKCVRLEKGKKETTKVFNESPVDQAIYFEQLGCKKLHIVDLDAAFGKRDINTKSIIDIRKAVKIPIQLGGGIRKPDHIKMFFDHNIDHLIIGSFAVNDFEKVIEISSLFENKIYISLDILNNKIMIKGWEHETSYEPKDIIKIYEKTKIRGYVLTDVSRDGMLSGLDTKIIKENLKLSEKKFIVGGGLTSYEDIFKLKKIYTTNLEGVIAGKSIYVGNIEIKKAESILSNNA